MKNLISFSIIALLAIASITAVNNFSTDEAAISQEVLAELEISPDSFLMEMDLSEDELRQVVAGGRGCYQACYVQMNECYANGFGAACMQQFYDCIDFCSGNQG